MRLFVLMLLIGFNSYSNSPKSVQTKYSVDAFFNNSESYSYVDPYRQISRKGQNLEKVIIDSIRSAKKTIYLAVQEIRLPLIAQELIKQKLAGLDVRIILENTYNHSVLNNENENFYSKKRNKNLKTNNTNNTDHDLQRQAELEALVDIDGDGIISNAELMSRDAVFMLKANKIKVIDDLQDGSFGSGLMHHKFMVVDSKSLIISTANFTMSGIHGDILNSKTRGNANSLLRINSPALAKTFTEEFFQMWGGKFGASRSRFGLQKTYRGLSNTSVRNSKIAAQFSPTARRVGYNKSVNGLIAQTLSKAKKEVLISLFVFSDQKIANTLKDLKEKNEKMEIGVLIERKFATRNYSELLDLWGIQLRDDNCNFEYKNFPWSNPLKTAGTPNLIDGDMLHHKFAVIDEETVIVGSQNWSDSANTINDENVLIIKDTHIAKLYKQEYKRLNKFAQLGPSRALLKKIELLEQSCTSTY